MAKQIDKTEISDALIERPIGFSFRGRHFSVYPPTLGKIQLVARLLEALEIKDGSNMYAEALQVAETKRDVCIRLLAYYTLKGDACLDENNVVKRMRQLRKVKKADLASMLLVCLSMDKSDEILKFFGLDKEAKRLSKVNEVKKKDKSSVDFAGKSIWGTMIDSACQRYGWTYQYVLWGVSYCALKMLMADQVKTVFLTKEEQKRAGAAAQDVVISADDKGALETFIKTQSWK